MPVFAPGVSYTQLQLKPPLGLRTVISKQNIQNAMSLIGTDNITEIKWGLIYYACPTTNTNCSSPSEAIETDLIYNGSQFYLQVTIGTYYVSSPITLQYNYPLNPDNLTDAVIDVYFQGKNIQIYGNGKLLFSTDMLKDVGSIQQLTSDSAYLNADGETVSGNNDYLTFNVQFLPVLNIAKIIDIIIPIAVVFSIVAFLPRLLSRVKPA